MNKTKLFRTVARLIYIIAAVFTFQNAYAQPYVYWVDTYTTTKTVSRSGLTGSNVETVNTESSFNGDLSEVEVDTTNNRVYWNQSGTKKIFCSTAAASSTPTAILTSSADVYGIALDVSGGKIYWSEPNEIKRATITGCGTAVSGVETISNTAASNPYSLAFAANKIYHTNGSNIRVINVAGSAPYSGSNMIALGGSAVPFSLALDTVNNKIYWAEDSDGVGNGSGTLKIRRASLSDGSNIEDIVSSYSGNGELGGIALDVAAGNVYWSQWQGGPGRIKRRSISATSDTPTTIYESGAIIRGIALDVSGTRSISGTVTIGGTATGVQGVVIDAGVLGSTSTDSSGNYSIGGIAHESTYTITPYYGGQTLNPTSASGVVEENATADFVLGDAPRLYFSDPGSFWASSTRTIKRAEMSASNASNSASLVSSSSNQFFPSGIAIDAAGGKMYFADLGNVTGDLSGGELSRANLDGSSVQTLVSGVNPRNVALDLVHQKVYFSDLLSGRILKCNFDGSSLQIVGSGLTTASGVAVDVSNGKVYWTDEGNNEIDNGALVEGKIERANLDGSGVETLIDGSGFVDFYPTAIVIDVEDNKFYWGQNGNDEDGITGNIGRANLNGASAAYIENSGSRLPLAVAIDTLNDKLYYTDTGSGSVRRINLDGSGDSPYLSGLTYPTGVAILPTYGLSGTVLLGSSPLSGVTVTDSGLGSATSNGSGVFSFPSVLSGNSYSLTATKTGYSFSPSSRSGTITGTTTADFSATLNNYALTGSVTLSGQPVVGAAIDGGGLGIATTDSSGRYEFSAVPFGSSFLLTPSYGTYTFTPASTSGTVVGNASNDFSVVTYSISGNVSLLNLRGSGLPGVTISDGARSTTTDSNGNFTLSGVPVGSYTLSASKSGYKTSTAQSVTISNASRSGFTYTAEPTLVSTQYAVWNGFIGIDNIIELTNKGSSEINATVQLYGLGGASSPLGSSHISIPPKKQFDVPVNSINGFSADTVGTVSVTVSDSSDFEGRLLQYIRNSSGSVSNVTSVPFENPRTTSSWVLFNTYPPSGLPTENVYNWLSLTNLSSNPQTFTIRRYNQAGILLSTSTVGPVRGYGNIDVEGGHENPGPRSVGLMQVVPETETPYLAKMSRYGVTGSTYNYVMTSSAQSALSAIQYVTISAGADAANWVEVANITGAFVGVTIELYNNSGVLADTLTRALSPHSQEHINSRIALLPGESGYAKITASSADSILVQSASYFADPDSGYISAAAVSLGRDVYGETATASYNLYFDMYNWLRLNNVSNETVNITLTVVPSIASGGSGSATTISLPAHKGNDFDLHNTRRFGTAKDSYGTFTVESSANGSVLADIIRISPNSRGGIEFTDIEPAR